MYHSLFFLFNYPYRGVDYTSALSSGRDRQCLSPGKVGVSVTNLSLLKTGKAKGVRFSTLEAICETLDCQPGDVLKYRRE